MAEPPVTRSPSEESGAPHAFLHPGNRWLHVASPFFVLAAFAIANRAFLADCNRSVVPGGWDGAAHYGIASIYSSAIYPAWSGWVPEYFAGMPFPDFYPPMLYVLVATLAHLGLSLRAAFFVVSAGSTLSLPPLVTMCAARAGRDWLAGLVAGGIAVGTMMHEGGRSMLGLTLDATFNFGLYSQPLACAFLLLCFFFALRAHRSFAAAGGAALCLGLVPLTSVHVVWNAALLLVPLVAVRLWEHRRHRSWRRIAWTFTAVGAIGVLMALAWVLPMLSRLEYVPTEAMQPVEPIQIVRAFLRVMVYVTFAAVVAHWRRQRVILALVASIVAGIAVTLLPAIGPLRDMALQPWRLLAVVEPLSAMAIGYLVAQVRLVTTRSWAPLALAASIVALFLWYSRPYVRASAVVSEGLYAGYQRALGPIRGHSDGRVLVELGEGNEGFSMQALSGLQGNPTTTTVFRESSITSLFAVPLRNSFSSKREEYGVDSKARYYRLERDTPEIDDVDRRRLALFDVHYIAAGSEQLKSLLRNDPADAERISPPGPWETYSWKTDSAYAEIPAYTPVLTFASFSVKRRPDVGFDYIRLGEEMFVAGWLDVPLVLSPSPLLDDASAWSGFHQALITQYRSGNDDLAVARVDEFSRAGDVFLLADPGQPLFERLRRLADHRPSIRVVDREPAEALTTAASAIRGAHPELPAADVEERAASAVVEATCRHLFQVMDENKRAIIDAPRVVSAVSERGALRVSLSEAPREPVPVWIKQTFFPGWLADEGSRPLMATPTFQLVFADRRDVTLRYQPDRFVVARLAGALGLLGGAALALAGRRRRSRH